MTRDERNAEMLRLRQDGWGLEELSQGFSLSIDQVSRILGPMDDRAKRARLERHFWSHVDKTQECWLWTGAKTAQGYGHYGTSSSGNPHKAHRMSWFLTFGKIADGMLVCHKCDHPSCVNPDHLFLGTHQDNMDDMNAKGRSKQLTGGDHWKVKLSDQDIVEINTLRENGIPTLQLAGQFGISKTHVYRVLRGEAKSKNHDDHS